LIYKITSTRYVSGMTATDLWNGWWREKVQFFYRRWNTSICNDTQCLGFLITYTVILLKVKQRRTYH
jgi:hypothetical protein